jgi:hypothetical protein
VFFRENVNLAPALHQKIVLSALPGGSFCTPHCNVSLVPNAFFAFYLVLRAFSALQAKLEMRGDMSDGVTV